MLLDVGGVRVATDPALTPRLGLLQRRGRLDLAALPRPDVVLISHLHLDHLHGPSLELLGPDVHLVLPVGGRRLIEDVPVGRITEVRPGDRVDLPGSGARSGVSIEVHPAEHSEHRWPFGRLTAPAVGYVIRPVDPAQPSVYFAGDTDLFAGMAHLGRIDIAALPIWGWGPSLGPGHLDPDRAARAAQIIDPRTVVPIHWGTYHPARLSGKPPSWFHRPISDFARELQQIGRAGMLRELQIGQTWQVQQ